MSSERLPGLLIYQLRNFIEEDLARRSLTQDENQKLTMIVDNWYLGDESKIRGFLERQQLDQLNELLDHYRYRLYTMYRQLYLLEYYRLLEDLKKFIIQYHLHDRINDVIDYSVQRLGNIKKEDLVPLIRQVYDNTVELRPEDILSQSELERLRTRFDGLTHLLASKNLASDNDRAYQYISELYDSLSSIGLSSSNQWRVLTIDLIDRAGDKLSESAVSYVQQMLKMYHNNSITKPIKNTVIVG